MLEREFIYWLRGFFEMEDPEHIDIKRTKMIKEHLDLTFKNMTLRDNPPVLVAPEFPQEIKTWPPSIITCDPSSAVSGGTVC